MNGIEVILLILTDLNGKISGPLFENPASAGASALYARLRQDLNCQATVYGQKTMEEGYSDGLWQQKQEPVLGCFEDYRAPASVDHYIVSLDPQGSLTFEQGVLIRKKRAPAHVIQVLTGQVSQAYLNELKVHGVSWIYGGETEISLSTVLEKLEKKWKISKLLVAGGGLCDWSFARENLLDELNLVVAPVATANPEAVSVFESLQNNDQQSIAYDLVQAQADEDHALWLQYRKR